MLYEVITRNFRRGCASVAEHQLFRVAGPGGGNPGYGARPGRLRGQRGIGLFLRQGAGKPRAASDGGRRKAGWKRDPGQPRARHDRGGYRRIRRGVAFICDQRGPQRGLRPWT